MTKLIRPILPGFLLIILAASALAETKVPVPTQGSIQGTIIEKRGYVMAGLPVIARNIVTGAEYQTTSRAGAGPSAERRDGFDALRHIGLVTDANADFSFDNLEPGRYLIASECEGVDHIIGAVVFEPGKTA